MSRKTIAARRAAFLKALRETGNQTLAAERARIARSWVHKQRTKDPAFDGACRAAIAETRTALERLRASGEGGRKPPSGWGYLDGEELVVKAATGRRIQVTRARPDQWTPSGEARFLAVLAATCNVKAACTAVGMSTTSAYAHRQRWSRFARLWDEAVRDGYARIEAALVENCCNLFSAPEHPPEIDMGPITVEQAIRIVQLHRNEVHGVGRKAGRWRRPRALDEVKASILRKLEAIERARGLGEAERAADAREYRRRRER